MKLKLFLFSLLAGSFLVVQGCDAPKDGVYHKPRTIVTCDPELDDNNSMIRFILHSTDFKIDGLIYTSSRFHWKGDGKGTTQFIEGSEYDQLGLGPQTSWRFSPDERFIDDIVDAYEKCYPNLKVHDPDYPTPEALRSVIAWGNCDFEGDWSQDTEGSELIKKNILDDDPGPLFIQAWGGSSSIAAALRSIEDEYRNTTEWDAIYRKVCDKVVLCLSGDQDNAYNKFIAVNWPDIYVQNLRGSMGRYDNSEYSYLTSPEWTAENLRIGPLGELVRCWGDGKQMVPGDVMDMIGPYKGESVQELADMGYIVWTQPKPVGTLYGDGDSGCYFNLIDNGLRAWEDPTWGGWAGRWDPKSGQPRSGHPTYMSTDIIRMHKMNLAAAEGKTVSSPFADFLSGSSEDVDGSPEFPNFYPERNLSEAARMKWSVTSDYDDANHYPELSGPFDIEASPGETLVLKIKATDPDGDQLALKWWNFPVGTYDGHVAVDSPESARTTVTVPADAKPGETIHFVLQATDDGTPQLTRYLRTVITVK